MTRVDDALTRVQLAAYTGRYPRQLSGGQQQRVALARALVIRPDLLLLDEPLSNLDAKLRQEMRTEIRDLVKDSGATAVYVTHDQEEALSMADRLVVMNRGRVVQSGTPRELFERPAQRFVAGFIGAANLLPGRVVSVDDGRAVLDVGGLTITGCAAPGSLTLDQPAVAVLRPEHLQVQSLLALGDQAAVTAMVVSVSYGGSTSRYRLRLADGTTLVAHTLDGAAPLSIDAPVRVTWPAERVWIMPDDPSRDEGVSPE